MPRREPNKRCPVGQCIQDELERVFSSAESAMIEQLGRKTVADIVNSVRARCEEQDAA